MFALIRKYRELIGLLSLLAAAGVTLFAHSKVGDEITWLEPVRQGVVTVEAPVERALNGAIFAVIDAWQGYVDLRGVRKENLTLRQKLLHAQGEQQSEVEIVKENERLRSLLNFADSLPLKTVAAGVVGDSLAPAATARVVRIGVGAKAGVRRGMPVVAEQGVVGRVDQVFPNSADVQLIVDRKSAVAVRVERSRARANVMGTGHDRRADLEYALRSDDIQEGDVLVTSGTDQVFPPGLTVGKVVDVQRKAGAMFLKAAVAPSADPRTLEEVLVVLGSRESLTTEPNADATPVGK